MLPLQARRRTVDLRRWLLSAKNHHRSRWLALAGALLAVGAPAGVASLWAVLVHTPAQELRVITLWFVGLSTAAVLATFGAVTGWLMDALVDAREQLAQEALEDHLTRIANRRAMQRALAAELRRHDRTGEPVALIMLDVDRFKRVNDKYGHPAGDAVLVTVANKVRDVCRGMDVAARVGGEEFAVLAPGLRAEDATKVAERVRRAVEDAETRFGDVPIKVTVSAGVASTDELQPPLDVQALWAAADVQLYRAKQGGRNLVKTATREPFPHYPTPLSLPVTKDPSGGIKP